MRMFTGTKFRMLKGVAAALVLSGVTLTVALAMGLLNLPGFQVTATQTWLGGAGTDGTIETTLSGVGSGFDVTDGTYAGWCIEDNFQANAPAGTLVTLLDSTDAASLPTTYQGVPWDKVNYLLNHKAGSVADVQAALWLLTWGSSSTFWVSPVAQAMYDDAVANGGDFVPGTDQVVAVILYGDGLGPAGYQDTIIEVPPPPPPPDGEGCTPGFWRNPKKFDLWPISPATLFSDVFSFGPADPLADTIRLGGGGENTLIRHGTAAYLNALSPDVDYFYTPAEVIGIVQEAYASGDFTAAKNMLEAQNDPTFCPLSN